jgi:hypothetical protein
MAEPAGQAAGCGVSRDGKRGLCPRANQELGTWNLELGIERLRTEEQVHISRPHDDRLTRTHKVLAYLFLAHEGPNPLCTVVVIATTYKSMYLALYRRDITLLFVVRHEQAPRETFTV